jgi:hypothetical protein
VKSVSVSEAAQRDPVLPVAASLFVTAMAVLVLGSAWSTLRNAQTPLSESSALIFYAFTRLATGCGLLAAGLTSIAALKRYSEKLLVLGEILGSAMLASIVILQTLSLWALRYFE